MSYLEQKYIGLLSPQLQNFKKKGPHTYNFRCPLCGDSKKNRSKARGYLHQAEGKYFYTCHNCHAPSQNFETFLRERDPMLFGDFLKEKLQDYYSSLPKKPEPVVHVTPVPVFHKRDILNSLTAVDDLAIDDPFRIYVESRLIPKNMQYLLFKCEKFKEFVNEVSPEKFDASTLKYEESRLVIPFFRKDKTIFGFTGRSLKPDAFLRYINIIIDDKVPGLYGMDRWNDKEKTYVVEGPLDSLFVPNCLATSGNDMVSALRDFPKDNFVCIYDNEPRKPETKAKVLKAVEHGYKVCVWPKNNPWKDINDMVRKGGMTPQEVVDMIDKNTFSGLRAKLEVSFMKS